MIMKLVSVLFLRAGARGLTFKEIIKIKTNIKKKLLFIYYVNIELLIKFIQRCKLTVDDYKLNLDMEDENNYLGKFLTGKKN